MFGLAVVRATMLLATVLWAWTEVLKIRRPSAIEPARALWTAGAALAVVHALLAFEVTYAWSHDAAFIDTARRTAAVTGIAWGGGIFVNYLFTAVWIADAVWWWVTPASYLSRPAGLERARAIFFLFMFFNGAIVFGSNTARGVGIPAVGAVCLAWVLAARRQTAHG